MIQRRVWLYLYSTANIAGSALALTGLGLFFAGLIDDWWPLIVAGLYLVGYRLAPRRHAIHLDEALAHADRMKAAEKLIRQARGQLSAPVLEVLDRVWETLQALLDRLDRFDANDKLVHDIRQTAVRHLPELLEPYLALPPAFARFHPLREGKTARDLLIERLGALESALNSTLHDALNEDVDRLRAQSAFLEQTFPQGRDWLR